MDHCVIETPAGRLRVWEINGCVAECAWVSAPLRDPATPLLEEAAKEIGEYFRGERMRFELPLATMGDPLAQRVWREILSVPYGKTVTAAAIADRLKRRRELKQIIRLCNSNPLALFVPCHRVVGEKNDGGYVGGMAVKYALWEIEGITKKEER